MKASSFFKTYCGPGFQAVLGLVNEMPLTSEERAALGAEVWTTDRTIELQKLLVLAFERSPVEDLFFLSQLVDESIQMGKAKDLLPVLIAHFGRELLEDNYLGRLVLGSEAWSQGDYASAKFYFQEAHKEAPEEVAPILNLCRLAFQERDNAGFVETSEIILGMDPNHGEVWGMLADNYNEWFGDEASVYLKKLGDTHSSWLGKLMAVQIEAPEDFLYQVQEMEGFSNYKSDPLFLIEYTGALGKALQYDRIPSLVWEFESKNESGVPWQLYAHALQAFLGMEDEASAKRYLHKLLAAKDLPPQVYDTFSQLKGELA